MALEDPDRRIGGQAGPDVDFHGRFFRSRELGQILGIDDQGPAAGAEIFEAEPPLIVRDLAEDRGPLAGFDNGPGQSGRGGVRRRRVLFFGRDQRDPPGDGAGAGQGDVDGLFGGAFDGDREGPVLERNLTAANRRGLEAEIICVGLDAVEDE